jgi:V/A-type H+/Na+-transporting ATPase subunit E
MTQDIQSLIEKIQKDGVEAARLQAQEIEAQAKRQAEAILAQAQAQSQEMLAQAKESILRSEAMQKAALVQARRDMLIALRADITGMLDSLIRGQVRQALSQEAMAKIVADLIARTPLSGGAEVEIQVPREQVQQMETSLRALLSQEVRKGVTVKAGDLLQGGFVISFDSGKSSFDFSDKALAEFIGTALKPSLKELFEDPR